MGFKPLSRLSCGGSLLLGSKSGEKGGLGFPMFLLHSLGRVENISQKFDRTFLHFFHFIPFITKKERGQLIALFSFPLFLPNQTQPK